MPEDSTELTRRRMLLGAGFALTATAGFAAIGLTGPAATSAGATDATGGDPQVDFDETYRGRRIQGWSATGHQHHSGHQHGGHIVLIDGQELHAMQNADGTWVSVMNHYQTYRTPRALARAAVINLQGASLLPIA